MVRVTSVGSLPGRDVAAAVRLVLDATPDLPALPELPARGPWAGIVGRGTALLEGLGAELAAGEWSLAATPGIDQRRARATLRDDLDVLEEEAHGWAGSLKVQAPGPWTLAAALFRPLGGRVLGDRGARTDLAESLAEGVRGLLAEVRRRLPAATVVLQIDEPGLPAVLGGRVPTEGGFFRHRPVEEAEVAGRLATLTGLGVSSVVHCCTAGVPISLLSRPEPHGAGFAALGLDVTLLDTPALDAVAEAVQAGAGIHLGVLGALEEPSVDLAVRRALDPLRPLELGPVLADALWLTPTCGLAGAPVARVPRVLAALRQAAPLVDERLR